jgi:SAM-dependent methyltransferase
MYPSLCGLAVLLDLGRSPRVSTPDVRGKKTNFLGLWRLFMTPGTVNFQLLEKEYSDPTSLGYKKIHLINTLIPEGGRLLDIGMGTGALLSLRVGRHQQIIGIDNDDTSVAICKEKFGNNPEVEVTNAGISDIKNRVKGTFSCITCLDILEHIDEKDVAPSLQNIFSLLAEDGIFIFSGPGMFEKIRIFLGRSPTHLHSHTPHGWSRYVQNAGFKILDVQSVEYPVIHSEFLRKKFPIFGKCCVIVGQKRTDGLGR